MFLYETPSHQVKQVGLMVRAYNAAFYLSYFSRLVEDETKFGWDEVSPHDALCGVGERGTRFGELPDLSVVSLAIDVVFLCFGPVIICGNCVPQHIRGLYLLCGF